MRPGVLHDVNVPSFVTYVPVLSAEGVSIVLQSVTPPPDAVLAPRRNSSVENFWHHEKFLRCDIIHLL